MLVIVIGILILLEVFGTHKLCKFLNNGDVESNKGKNIILKISFYSVFLLLIVMFFSGLDAYLNGTESAVCWNVDSDDCTVYGMSAVVQGLFGNFYWALPMILIILCYIFNYKIKYKMKLGINEWIFFSFCIVLSCICLFPLSDTIIDRLYFYFNDYKYELIIKGYDYNSYYVYGYDKKINVIKKQYSTGGLPDAEPIYNGEYVLRFSKESFKAIDDYVESKMDAKKDSVVVVDYSNVTNSQEINIINAIVNNDEKYIGKSELTHVYKITTDLKYKTLLNDGGSNTNVYYYVDFETSEVIKYEDRYIGFEGYEYKDKVVYEKEVDNALSNELENIIISLLKKEDFNDGNFSFYVIEYDGKTKEIYNAESIKQLENIFTLIDNK